MHYNYIDQYSNKKFCKKILKYPETYDKLVQDKNEFINDCSVDGNYEYELRKKCYTDCPLNSTRLYKKSDEEKFEEYFCKSICFEELPFEIIKTQQCVKYCSVKDLSKKLGILNYQENKRNNPEEKENNNGGGVGGVVRVQNFF